METAGHDASSSVGERAAAAALPYATSAASLPSPLSPPPRAAVPLRRTSSMEQHRASSPAARMATATGSTGSSRRPSGSPSPAPPAARSSGPLRLFVQPHNPLQEDKVPKPNRHFLVP